MNQRLPLLLVLFAATPCFAADTAVPPQSRITGLDLSLPDAGLAAAVSWKTENMASCLLTAGAVSLEVEASPVIPVTVVPGEAEDTLVLRCRGPYGTGAAAVTMPAPRLPATPGPPVIRYFRPVNITYFMDVASFTAEWQTSGASQCEIEPGRLASIPVALQGSLSLETSQDRTYRLYCRNPYGDSTESFRIEVGGGHGTGDGGHETDDSGGDCGGSSPDGSDSAGYYFFSGCMESACNSEPSTYPDSTGNGGSCSEDEDTADASGGSCSDDDSSSDSGSCSESSDSAGSDTETDSGSSCSDSSPSPDTDSSSCSSSGPETSELDAAAGMLASGGWPGLTPLTFPPLVSGKKRLCLRRPGRTGTGLFPFFTVVLIPGALRLLRWNAHRVRSVA